MNRTRLTRFAALTAALGIAISTPGIVDANGPADPGPPPDDVEILGSAGDWTRFSGPYGFVYGVDFMHGDDLYVIANGTIGNVCGLEEPVIAPAQTGRLRQRTDGRWTLRDTIDEQLVHTTVYEADPNVPIFAWFDQVCPAAAGGAPLPEPVAAGMTDIYFDAVMDAPWWFTFDFESQPPGRYYNGTRGVVEMADGSKAYLISEVRYRITEDEFVPGREFISLKPID